MQCNPFFVLAVLAASLSLTAQAADIKNIKLDTPTAKAGQPLKITLTGDDGASQNCGLRIEYGDGEGTDIKITSSDGIFPRTLTKTYAKGGNYTINVKGKRVTSHFGCTGEASIKVVVENATPTPVATTSAKKAACPQNWELVAGSAKADGSFTCQVVKPARMDCGAGMAYFEKGNTLGCKKSGKK